MPNKPCILIDLNIVLDVLQKREPFCENSARLLAAVENGRVKGYLAAHSITTLFYIIEKSQSAADAKARITGLLQFLHVASTDQNTIERALNLDYGDFEDAVQMICAIQIKADYLITRNIKDYQPALLPVMQPVEFLNAL